MDPTKNIPDPEKPNDDLLDALVSFTGLFNPEVIWQEKQELDDLEEQELSSSSEEE